MIPKLIHYCWLSDDPYPKKIQHCLNSWEKVIPDYEFMLWDKSRIDINEIPWVKEAYEAKMYAFAADYIRLYALYNFGGIYLDSDVEVLRRFDDLLDLPYFIGGESFNDRVECAAFGAVQGMPWIKDCLSYYKDRHFINKDGEMDKTVMPSIVNGVISNKYSINLITRKEEFDYKSTVFNIFPNDWFCANVHKSANDFEPTYIISPQTYCVHHFANSWVKVNRFKLGLKKLLLRILKQ